MEINDMHCHVSMIGQVSTMADADSLKNVMTGCGYRRACIQTITYYKDRNLNRNPLSLMLKAENPDFFYVFGGILYPKPGNYESCAFASEAKKLWEMGCDGLKLFAKPTVQGEFRLPLDAPQFMELYQYCQDNGVPVLFHVGDPSTFWDKSRIPDWAMANGWYYGEGDFPAYGEQYAACEHFLTEFPRLRIIFPHFFFMADDLPRLEVFMRRHENMMLDITPGSELYFHLSEAPERARAFFVEFADRILYGTDTMGDGRHPREAMDYRLGAKADICRFLETGDSFAWNGGGRVNGLSLPDDALDRIYRRNFLRVLGPKPRSLVRDSVLAACGEWHRLAEASPDTLEINLKEFQLVIQRIREALQAPPAMDFITENRSRKWKKSVK